MAECVRVTTGSGFIKHASFPPIVQVESFEELVLAGHFPPQDQIKVLLSSVDIAPAVTRQLVPRVESLSPVLLKAGGCVLDQSFSEVETSSDLVSQTVAFRVLAASPC